jgi:hypothetical protein
MNGIKTKKNLFTIDRYKKPTDICSGAFSAYLGVNLY